MIQKSETTFYKKFDLTNLKEGQNLTQNIYYKNNDDYVLVFSSGTVTKSVIHKLRKIEFVYSILLTETDTPDLEFDFNIYNKRKETFSVDYTKYESIIKKCEKFFADVFETKKINVSMAISLIEDITNHVNDADNINIVQLINNVRSEDKYLYTHCVNVAYLNGVMGKWLKFSKENILKLTTIGFFHDIGKTMIPTDILNKPGVFTPSEFETMKKHSVYSYKMLVEAGINDNEILMAVRGHHEKTNGTGYPDGLTINKLSTFTRITTISDMYDAMVATRIYKKVNSPFDILSEFAKGRFADLDTTLVNVFLSNMPKELVGKNIFLSNGKVGTVHYIHPSDFAHPFVMLDGQVVHVGEDVHCLYVF